MNTQFKPLGLLERIAAGENLRHTPRSLSNYIAEELLTNMGQNYRAPLQELLGKLQAVESRAYNNAPKVAVDVLSGSQDDVDDQASAIESAYLLGMLQLASHLVAISIDSRFEDVAHEVIQDETYRVLLNRINIEGETTVEGLAKFFSREESTVRGQLYRMNDLGIVCWRLTDSWGRFYRITEAGKTLLGIQD